MAGPRWLAAKAVPCLMIAGLLACGGDDTVGPRIPASIVIVPNQPSIPQKTTRQLTATVVDAAGHAIEGETVTFSSSDTAIVTVSPSGLLTSVGPLGTADITASDGDLTAMITAKVIYTPSSVIVTPNPIVVNPGLSVQLYALATDANGDPVSSAVFTYVSNDPALVTVDAYGVVHSVGPAGSTSITVHSGGLSTDVPVSIAQIPTTLSVNPISMVLAPGTDEQITASVLDAAGQAIAGVSIAYTSDNPSVFTVSGAGLVHAVGPDGSGSVTVTSGDLVASVGVFVGDAPPGTILADIDPPGDPWGVTVTPSGKYYVTLLGGGVTGGAFPAYTFNFNAPTGATGLSIAVNAAGTRGYVATALSASGSSVGVGVIDLTNSTLIDVIPANDPLAVALSPDGARLFVGSGIGFQMIDVASKSVVSETAVGTINEITHHPTLPLLYASVNGGSVIEIDANTGNVVRTFPVQGLVQGNAVSLDGTELYVVDEGGDLIVWDLATNQQKERVTGGGGFGLGLSPDGKFLYVAGNGTVRIYDRASRALLQTVNPGGDPRRIGFDPATGIAIVTNAGAGVVFIK